MNRSHSTSRGQANEMWHFRYDDEFFQRGQNDSSTDPERIHHVGQLPMAFPNTIRKSHVVISDRSFQLLFYR